MRQSKMQNLQNDNPHTDRGQRLGQQSSLGATPVFRRPMLSTLYMHQCCLPYISTKCGKQYVGEAGDHVNQRLNGNRDDWNYKRFARSPARQHGPEKGIICFSTYATFICKFYIFFVIYFKYKISKEGERRQANKSFALLMINPLHII